MRTLMFCLALILFVSCTQGQVQPVPKAVTDSIAALRADVTLLRGGGSVNLQPILDSLAAHRTRLGTLEGTSTVYAARITNLETKIVTVRTGRASFTGTAWRLAIHVPGVTSAWTVQVGVIGAAEAPAYDYVNWTTKTDSIIVRRPLNGTSGLMVEYLAITP